MQILIGLLGLCAIALLIWYFWLLLKGDQQA